jgi:two-component system response regulator YesN
MSRVLVVDDDPGTLLTFGAILRLASFDVATAATGRGALQVVQRHSCDVIVADLRLPDMSGVEILRVLREEKTAIPFVLMTAFGSVESAVDALKLGAIDYIEKPVFDVQLVEVVQRALLTSNPKPSIEPIVGLAEIDRRVTQTLQIIEEEYWRRGLRLRVIARRLKVSTEHLCRLLKRDTGHGFCFHLHLARVSEAQRLLIQTNLSVKEIADRTGYTPSSLDRYFKEVYGILPHQARRSIQ